MNVVFTTPTWSLSGVNTFSANLVRGLNNRNIPACILLTYPDRRDPNLMAAPLDIPIEVLPQRKHSTWQDRWHILLSYLETKAPCVYIPNYDWNHSCISPKLSNSIVIVGIIHSDEQVHYDHAYRLGKYWNAIVAVSNRIKKVTLTRDPGLSQKLITIPYGVPIPNKFPDRRVNVNAPLKIIYTGRLIQYQKRVFDLIKVSQAMKTLQIPFTLTIVGIGEDQNALESSSRHLISEGVVKFLGAQTNERVYELLKEHDVFLLTSDFEGMPVSLIEAMAHGCVPVVTDIHSGIPEIISHGSNGYKVPVGDIRTFTECLGLLGSDIDKRKKMSIEAFKSIRQGGYHINEVTDRYLDLFRELFENLASERFKRPPGKIIPPIPMSSLNAQLPNELLRFMLRVFGLLHLSPRCYSVYCRLARKFWAI